MFLIKPSNASRLQKKNDPATLHTCTFGPSRCRYTYGRLVLAIQYKSVDCYIIVYIVNDYHNQIDKNVPPKG